MKLKDYNWKFWVYFICLTGFILIFNFFEWFSQGDFGNFFFFGLVLVFFFSFFSFKIYNSVIGLKENNISKGLLYSIIFGVLSISGVAYYFYKLYWSLFPHSVNINTKFYVAALIIFCVSIIICVLIDLFFNKKLDVKWLKLFFGAGVFYLSVWIFSASLMLLIIILNFFSTPW